MEIEYGFDPAGGFIVVCRKMECGAYAFPTSINADRAKHSARRVARKMIREAITDRLFTPHHIATADWGVRQASIAAVVCPIIDTI